MCRKHPEEHEEIGKIFDQKNTNILWSDFENMLAKPNITELVKYIMKHSSNDGFENSIDNLYFNLKSLFHEWVESIPMTMFNHKYLNIKKDAFFLNFNYTNTLENYYHIADSKICYIHGATKKNPLESPVVGHITSPNYISEKHNDIIQSIPANISKLTQDYILKEIETFYDSLSKEPKNLRREFDLDKNHCPVNYYIEQHTEFFDIAKNCSDVFVLGHSLTEIDKAYFVRIHADSPNAIWHISYLSDNEITSKIQKLCKMITICPKNIIMFKMNNL